MPPNIRLELIARQLSAEQLPPGWELVASGRAGRVARHRGEGLYYREYHRPRPLAQMRETLCYGLGGRARRAERSSEALRLAGFSAPTALARGSLANGNTYLFYRALPGESVSDWLRHALAERDPASLALRRRLLRELGTFVGRLHAAGFVHGDLRPRHILAHYQGGQFRFALVDTERARLRRPPPGTWLLADLRQLASLPAPALTRSDRWRFFLAWRQQHPALGHLEARLLAAEACQGAPG
jgi:serine/threonine protein kinase